MKKLLVVLMVMFVVILSGSGNNDVYRTKRNYFWTNLDTGEQIHGLTQYEFDQLTEYWESRRSRYNTYRQELDIDWSKTTVEWVDVN